jgi:phospholipid/cholesterol/gamma-HCH transport system substrate-binding protein
METKAHYVAIGAFVLTITLGMLIALLWLAGAQYREEYAYYKTYFSGAVTGLGTGTPVRYNGIDVGRVSKLDFDPGDPKSVIVTLSISPSLPIHDDSIASIASEGLTGGSYVEIDGGSKNAPVLRRTLLGAMPVIRSKQSTMQELMQSAPQLVAKLNKIADHLNDVLNDDNRKAIAQTLDHLRNMTADLDRNGPNIDRLLANLSTGSVTLNTDLGDVHRVLGHADEATLGLTRIEDDLDAQVNGAQIAQFVAQTKALVQSLTTLSNDIEAQPTKLIFGDKRKGYTPP